MRTALHHEVFKHPHQDQWIIFIHGAGGNTNTWKHQLAAFKPFYNLLVLDLRDHGQSKDIQPPYDSYNFEIASNDIKKVLDNQHITHAHFVTLSFGSVLIQDFSTRYPSMVDKLVIAGGFFGANILIKTFVQSARFLNLFLPYRTMYFVFSYLLMPKKRSQAARKAYQRQAFKLTDNEYLKWLGLYAEFFKLLKRFQQHPIDREMHVIMGADDYMFLKSAKDFVTRHKHVRLYIIPKSGHICNIETPAAFNQLALECLSEKPQ